MSINLLFKNNKLVNLNINVELSIGFLRDLIKVAFV